MTASDTGEEQEGGGDDGQPPGGHVDDPSTPEAGAATGDREKAENPPPDHWSPPKKGLVISGVIVLLAIVAVLAILAAWQLPPFGSAGPATDDAYVQGRTTSVAPQVSGYITQVLVSDFAHVKRAQLLVLIDDSSYRAQVEEAQASLAVQVAQLANNTQSIASAEAALQGKRATLESAKAQFLVASADLRRANALVGDGSISAREHDQTVGEYAEQLASLHQAQADVQIAEEDVLTAEVQSQELEAEVQEAKAKLDQAQIDLGHTRIYAPDNGQLGEVDVHVGSYVSSGVELFSLVPPDHWVIASYKETQMHDVFVGQHASFTVDALAGRRFDGFVQRISPATDAEFALLKPDDATGNFVKVPQRIDVRIAIPNQALVDRLRPGMSVEASIDTASGAGGPAGPPP